MLVVPLNPTHVILCVCGIWNMCDLLGLYGAQFCSSHYLQLESSFVFECSGMFCAVKYYYYQGRQSVLEIGGSRPLPSLSLTPPTPPFHLTTSKVVVIVWRLRGNIIQTVVYCNVLPLQWAQLTKPVHTARFLIRPKFVFLRFSGCMIYGK